MHAAVLFDLVQSEGLANTQVVVTNGNAAPAQVASNEATELQSGDLY